MARDFGIDDFRRLVQALADAWGRNDAPAAAALFQPDAIYMEPPDVQLFVGRDELRSYFRPLSPGTYLDLHHVWYDETSASGAIEFTFGTRGHDRASHGMALLHVVDGRIATWREYQVQGPSSFDAFTATDGKAWRWHAGNYP